MLSGSLAMFEETDLPNIVAGPDEELREEVAGLAHLVHAWYPQGHKPKHVSSFTAQPPLS